MSSLSTAQESTPDSAIAPNDLALPTVTIHQPQPADIVYPSADGKPLAETYLHLNAIIAILKALQFHLCGQQATVLADQFLYYSQGYPRLRVAPDVMVIFNVAPGGRDNYKIWEEGEIPSVIFEVTSPGTRQEDQHHKHWLYQQMGVQEYWLFDPKNEWIEGQLRGYQLGPSRTPDGDPCEAYLPITDNQSAVLGLRLEVCGPLLRFFNEATGQWLPMPDEIGDVLAERDRAAAERDRTATERDQAAAERDRAAAERDQERQAKEAALAELAELRERLRQLETDA